MFRVLKVSSCLCLVPGEELVEVLVLVFFLCVLSPADVSSLLIFLPLVEPLLVVSAFSAAVVVAVALSEAAAPVLVVDARGIRRRL